MNVGFMDCFYLCIIYWQINHLVIPLIKNNDLLQDSVARQKNMPEDLILNPAAQFIILSLLAQNFKYHN